MTPQAAAIAAAVVLGALAGLHIALALGAPLGSYAWGGRHQGALPTRQQWGSALLVPLLLAMALMLLMRAGLLYPGLEAQMTWPAWAIFCFLVTMMFGSFRSAGVEERRQVAPILLVAAVATGLLAFGPQ